MSVIQIRKAQREGARLVIGLAATSGNGKTYTAIQLAYGLANFDASKVGLLDTENKRGSLYSNCLKKATTPTNEQFLIGDLYAPFSPQRYIDSIKMFEEAGVEVLVIDSVTHEWEGTGGCEEIADDGGKIANWKKAKREHKRFMNALLQSDMHIIVCIRAREKTSFANPKAPVSLGIQPIQEKNFMFEMTASLMMHNEGKSQEVLKCPDELRSILGRCKGYITADDGRDIRTWVDGGRTLSQEVERWKNGLLLRAEKGVDYIESFWTEKVPADVKAKMDIGFLEMVKASAADYDRIRAETSIAKDVDLDDSVASLNSNINKSPSAEELEVIRQYELANGSN